MRISSKPNPRMRLYILVATVSLVDGKPKIVFYDKVIRRRYKYKWNW